MYNIYDYLINYRTNIIARTANIKTSRIDFPFHGCKKSFRKFDKSYYNLNLEFVLNV